MRRKALHASILAAIVSAIMILLVVTARNGTEAFAETEQTVREINVVNARLDSEIMLLRLGIISNYDKLMTAELEMCRLCDVQHRDSNEFDNLIFNLRQKLSQIEEFKSVHAIVTNSFASFLKVVKQSLECHRSDPLPYRSLVDLETKCMRFYLSSSGDDLNQLEASINVCSKLINEGEIIWEGRKKTRQSIRLAKKLIENRNALSEIVNYIVNVPVETMTDVIMREALVVHELQLEVVRKYRIALAGLVVILFGFCVWQFYIAIQQAKQIRSANTSLELRVRERTQDLVKESRKAASFASIVQDSPYEIFILNQINFRMEEVNRGACTGTGWERDELLKKSFHDLTPDYDLMGLHQLFNPLSKGEVTTHEIELKLLQSNGETYDVLVNLYQSNYNSTPVFIAFVVDQTERKLLEQQLSQAQKLESIGQLAAGVAHEINTPMQFIGSNIEFLNSASPRIFNILERLQEMLFSSDLSLEITDRKDEVDELLKSSRYEHLKAQTPGAIADCMDGVERVVEIVRAMKDFSHPGSKEKSLANINELVRSASVVSKNRWKYVAKLDLELSPEIPDIECYPSELNQVLLNLIVNAADAINEHDKGSNDQLGSIKLLTDLKDEWIVIECEDTGGGITDEIRQKVFDPFFTTKDVGKGTGQGLAISHDIVVNKHGGVLELDTEVGIGSTFRFMLPIDDTNALPSDEQRKVLLTT